MASDPDDVIISLTSLSLRDCHTFVPRPSLNTSAHVLARAMPQPTLEHAHLSFADNMLTLTVSAPIATITQGGMAISQSSMTCELLASGATTGQGCALHVPVSTRGGMWTSASAGMGHAVIISILLESSLVTQLQEAGVGARAAAYVHMYTGALQGVDPASASR